MAGAGLARVALRYAPGLTAACGDVTVGGDHQSTHVGVDVLEGPNAIVLIAQVDLGMAGDVQFDTVRCWPGCSIACALPIRTETGTVINRLSMLCYAAARHRCALMRAPTLAF